MTFHRIVSEWATKYRLMLHSVTNGNRRFYIKENWDAVRSMPKSISTKFSPCVIMESAIEVEADGGRLYRNYPIYFFVRSEQMANDDAIAEAREEALYHCLNFLAWLKQKHEEDSPYGDYGRIEMEQRIMIDSTGTLEDGWEGVVLQISRLELLDLCINPDMYLDEEGSNEQND